MIVVQPSDGVLRAVEGGRVIWEDTAFLGFGFGHGALGLLVWFLSAHGSVERQALLVHELDACHGHVKFMPMASSVWLTRAFRSSFMRMVILPT